MSVAAMSAAAAASNAAARRAREAECQIVVGQFRSADATVTEAREYASCVQTLYPQPIGGAEIVAFKVLFITALIGMFGGLVWARLKNGFSITECLLVGLFWFLMMPFGLLFVVGVGYGIYWLFT